MASNQEKRQRVIAALNDPELTNFSNGYIARQCGVSNEFVNKLRAELGIRKGQAIYKTKHGTMAQMNISRIGSVRPTIEKQYEEFPCVPPELKIGDELTERYLEREICLWLKSQNIPFRRQFPCLTGTADIVTPDAVYEVEYRLSRAKLFEAVGQVMLYRQAINPAGRAVVVGYASEEAAPLYEYARQIGVEVMLWPLTVIR